MEINKIKTYSLEEIKKEFTGDIGTRKRENYEGKLRKAVLKSKNKITK